MSHRNCQIIYLLNSLHLAIPFPRIFTICNQILLYTEMFISTMPVYIRIFTKIPTNPLRILPQNIPPEPIYIHNSSSH